MTFIEAILLGIVQGLTEFLPVSSSGHLTLVGRLVGTDEAAMLSLTTWLHLGTLVAVFIVLWPDILAILKDLTGLTMRLLVVGTLPAVLVALLLKGWLDRLFAGPYLGLSFWLTGLILLAAASFLKRKQGTRPIGYKEALVAGLGQAFAILPGVSRSGSTITALLASDVERERAIRFSFLLSIPAVLGGLVLDLKDLLRGDSAAFAALGVDKVAVGILAAALSGWLVMSFMLRRLKRRGFIACALYLLVLGSLVLLDQTVLHWLF